ncbi:MAG: hypothetical protein AAGL98_10185, partial [Planctomycetota bacterium]
DMEARCGYAIAVEASDKMVGANFSVERGPATAAPIRRASEQSAVNMDWGFENDPDEAGADTSATEGQSSQGASDDSLNGRSSDDESNGRRRRRRRRRGGRRSPESAAGENTELDENGDAILTTPSSDDEDVQSASENVSNELDDDGDDDKPRARRGRRRGRRGGRRNRERQAQRDETGTTDDGSETEIEHTDATATDESSQDIPGFGPQPSLDAKVIAITVPDETGESTQAAGDTEPAAETGDETQSPAAVDVAETDTTSEDDTPARRPRRSRSRSGTSGTRTSSRRTKPKAEPDSDPASQTEVTADGDGSGDAEPVADSEQQKTVQQADVATTTDTKAGTDKTASTDRSKRTAPIHDKPRLERVVVGPDGNDDEAEKPADDKPTKRGWWQRRILGE